MPSEIMQFFTHAHLKPPLNEVSRPFCEIAGWVDAAIPDNAQKEMALFKLLEAKDCAVRAVISEANKGAPAPSGLSGLILPDHKIIT